MKAFGAKEWTVVIDAVCSLAVFFVGKYAGYAVEDLKFVIAALQPVVAILIGSVAFENKVKFQLGIR